MEYISKTTKGAGGKRFGAGRPKGSKNLKTIEKEKAQEMTKIAERQAVEEFKQRILKRIKPMTEAQIDSAIGLNVVYAPAYRTNKKTGKLEKTGRSKRVTDPDKIEELLNKGKEYYEIRTEKPNVRAAEIIFNLAFGKPKESKQESGDGDNFEKSLKLLFQRNTKTNDELLVNRNDPGEPKQIVSGSKQTKEERDIEILERVRRAVEK